EKRGAGAEKRGAGAEKRGAGAEKRGASAEKRGAGEKWDAGAEKPRAGAAAAPGPRLRWAAAEDTREAETSKTVSTPALFGRMIAIHGRRYRRCPHGPAYGPLQIPISPERPFSKISPAN